MPGPRRKDRRTTDAAARGAAETPKERGGNVQPVEQVPLSSLLISSFSRPRFGAAPRPGERERPSFAHPPSFVLVSPIRDPSPAVFFYIHLLLIFSHNRRFRVKPEQGPGRVRKRGERAGMGGCERENRSRSRIPDRRDIAKLESGNEEETPDSVLPGLDLTALDFALPQPDTRRAGFRPRDGERPWDRTARKAAGMSSLSPADSTFGKTGPIDPLSGVDAAKSRGPMPCFTWR